MNALGSDAPLMSGIDKVNSEVVAALAAAAEPIDLGSRTPLWYWLLTEAGRVGRQTTPGTFDPGEGLGPIGGRIVAEAIVGLLKTDEDSYLGQDRSCSQVSCCRLAPATPRRGGCSQPRDPGLARRA